MIDFNVKRSLFIILLPMILIAIFMFGCKKGGIVNNEPNIPLEYRGRTVNVQGDIYVQSREITFRVWDHGQIDGDIISLVVNDRVVLDTFELRGPQAIREVVVTLEFGGYNYVMLFAHNEGFIPPNTVALAIDDGVTEQEIILEANLYTNGAYNLIVD
ncbi:MAG: hypothetical protein OXI24_05825 [Candidatus Poribacteria bacterium]|nr:hypothetical protein [Candidatus Poribacteria bacterium]